MDGRSFEKSFASSIRSNRIHFQKIPNLRVRRTWWTHWKHSNYFPRRKRKHNITELDLSVVNRMVRGMFTGGVVGGKHALRKLETGDTHALTEDFAKLAVRVQRQLQNCARFKTRLVQRNKPIASTSKYPKKSQTSVCVKPCNRPNRQASNGKRCHRIFQKMEWNLFAKYLTPVEWWSFRLTSVSMVPLPWTWSYVWHGPPVDPYIGSRFKYALTVYPVNNVLCSITNITVLKIVVKIMLSMFGRERTSKIMAECQIRNLHIWKLVYMY